MPRRGNNTFFRSYEVASSNVKFSYIVWLSALCFISVSLCFFDKLEPIIAQLDLVLFASWQKKKEKKVTIILQKGKNMGS